MGRQKHKGRSRYWEQVRELADEHEWSIPEAREQWPRFYKKGGKRRKSPKLAPLVLAAALLSAAPTEGPTCPYCRLGFLVEEAKHTCSGCNTTLHQECHGELRQRCPTIGCSGRGNAARTTAPVGATIRIEPHQLPARRRSRAQILATLVALLSLVATIVWGLWFYW